MRYVLDCKDKSLIVSVCPKFPPEKRLEGKKRVSKRGLEEKGAKDEEIMPSHKGKKSVRRGNGQGREGEGGGLGSIVTAPGPVRGTVGQGKSPQCRSGDRGPGNPFPRANHRSPPCGDS